jgi:hypothetical protein
LTTTRIGNKFHGIVCFNNCKCFYHVRTFGVLETRR